jgi:hypothetical protein
VSYAPLKGKFAKIARAGSPEVVFPAFNWTLPIDGMPQDASNFRDGRKVMTTLDDADVTFQMPWDTGGAPTVTANGGIAIDADFDCRFYVDNLTSPTRFFLAPVKITRIEITNEGPTGRVLANITAKLNGAITYPIYT